MYGRVVKRALDLLLALMLCVCLSPVLIAVSVWVKLDSPGHVLFRQTRLGKDGKPFTVLKFRTMLETAPENVATRDLLHSADYITRSGRILRSSSLDELPQLFNIIKGDMSLVGFRPCIPQEEELDRLRREYGAYSVRPGITGLAQIRGRDELEPEEKARYDGVYARHSSLDYDFRILMKTIFAVYNHEGIKEGGS